MLEKYRISRVSIKSNELTHVEGIIRRKKLSENWKSKMSSEQGSWLSQSDSEALERDPLNRRLNEG